MDFVILYALPSTLGALLGFLLIYRQRRYWTLWALWIVGVIACIRAFDPAEYTPWPLIELFLWGLVFGLVGAWVVRRSRKH